MNEGEIYSMQMHAMAQEIEEAVNEVPANDLYRRPGPHQNPVGWNYWHLMRIWDLSLNLIQGRNDPMQDVWHRGNFTERSGYNPDGTGGQGSGTGMGHTDEEVDAVNVPLDVLHEYRDQLVKETDAFLAGASDEDFARELGQPRWNTVRERVQLGIIRNGWMHYGEIRYAKGILGHYDATYSAARS